MNQLSLNRTHQVFSSNTAHVVPESSAIQIDRVEPVKRTSLSEQTPLSLFVRERLTELGLKQSDFCRLNTFDQGMLSRIQNSMVFNLNLESVLKLAIGLQVSPFKILELIGRTDLHDLVSAAYGNEVLEFSEAKVGSGT